MKILLIEDDKFFREFYASKLKQKNIEVDQAADGEEGMNKILASRPDLVLLDLIMPNKDGFEVLEEMQQKKLTSEIPVLVFSTLGSQQDIQKARELGAKGYINKSFFDFDKLFNRILELGNRSAGA